MAAFWRVNLDPNFHLGYVFTEIGSDRNRQTMQTMKKHRKLDWALKPAILFMAALPASLPAQQTTLSQTANASTFVSSAHPNMNYGTLGAMEIAAPTAAQPNTEESLFQFNTAALESSFNADYGAGNWAVNAVTVTLFSNVATAGQQPGNSSFNQIAAGGFALDWLSDNNWSPTAVTWNTLPSLLPGAGNNTLASLGSFYWPATGSTATFWTLGLDPNLASDIAAGGEVTIFGQPAANSTVGYLFNTQTQGKPPVLNVTVDEVPEPSAMALMVPGLLGGRSPLEKSIMIRTRSTFTGLLAAFNRVSLEAFFGTKLEYPAGTKLRSARLIPVPPSPPLQCYKC
jgi:hypothetical protein